MARTAPETPKHTKNQTVYNSFDTTLHHAIYTKKRAINANADLKSLWDTFPPLTGRDGKERHTIFDLMRQVAGLGNSSTCPEPLLVGNDNKKHWRARSRTSRPSTILPLRQTEENTSFTTTKVNMKDRIFICPGCSTKLKSFDQLLQHITDTHTEKHYATASDSGAMKRSITFPPGPKDGRRFQRIKSWSDLAELEQESSHTADSKEPVFLDYWVHNTYNPCSFHWMKGYREVQLRSCQNAAESLLSANEEMYQWEMRTSGNIASQLPSIHSESLFSRTSVHLVAGIHLCAPSRTNSQTASSARGNQKQGSQGSRRGRVDKRQSQAGPSSSSGKKPEVRVEACDSILEDESGLRFACPYWKYHPIVHARCGQISFANVSLVRNHLLQCHYFEIFCNHCHRHFAKSEELCAHMNPRRCSQRKPEEAGIFDNEVWAELTKNKNNHLDARDPETRELRFPTKKDKWYHLWRLVLKDHTLPESPYFDESESWRPRPIRDKWRRYLEFAYQTAAEQFGQSIPPDSSENIQRFLYAPWFVDNFRQFMLDAFCEMLSNEQSQPSEPELESSSQQSDHIGPNNYRAPEIFIATPDTSHFLPEWSNNNPQPEAHGSNGTYYSASLYASNESMGISECESMQRGQYSANQNAGHRSEQDRSAVRSESLSHVDPTVGVSQTNLNGNIPQEIDRDNTIEELLKTR